MSYKRTDAYDFMIDSFWPLYYIEQMDAMLAQ